MGSTDGARVLIVDDHPVFRLGLSRVLAGEPGIGGCAEAAGVTAVRTVMAGGRYVSPRLRELVAAGADGGDAPAIGAVARLSDRELEIYALIGDGLSTRRIAERLELSVKTVESYRERIKAKLGLRTGHALTRSAVAWVLGLG